MLPGIPALVLRMMRQSIRRGWKNKLHLNPLYLSEIDHEVNPTAILRTAERIHDPIHEFFVDAFVGDAHAKQHAVAFNGPRFRLQSDRDVESGSIGQSKLPGHPARAQGGDGAV